MLAMPVLFSAPLTQGGRGPHAMVGFTLRWMQGQLPLESLYASGDQVQRMVLTGTATSPSSTAISGGAIRWLSRRGRTVGGILVVL